jgi:hypothetical protein
VHPRASVDIISLPEIESIRTVRSLVAIFSQIDCVKMICFTLHDRRTTLSMINVQLR